MSTLSSDQQPIPVDDTLEKTIQPTQRLNIWVAALFKREFKKWQPLVSSCFY